MFKKYITIYILFLQVFANDFIPLNNSAINYTQVFFKWPQIESVEYYILSIENNSLRKKYKSWRHQQTKSVSIKPSK